MVKFHLDKRVLPAYFAVLAVVGSIALYAYFSARKMISTIQGIADTHNVLFHAERLLTLAISIEAGQRGFSLTGNAEFLQPHKHEIDQIRPHFDALQALVQRHGRQTERLVHLATAIDTLVRFSSTVVEARKNNFDEAVRLNATLEGKNTLDRIRRAVAQLENEEKLLLADLLARNQTQITNFNYSSISLLIVTGSILVGLLFATNINVKGTTETQKQLTRASEKFQDLYDNAPCGYHSLDAGDRFVEINKTLLKWLGYESKDDVIGKIHFEDVIAPSDVPGFRDRYKIFGENGVVNNVEIRFRRTNGSEFPVMLNAVALFDEQGEFLKSRANTIDITQTKEAERQVISLTKELEAFTYSVSHDLRAPLRSIDGYTRILYEDYNNQLDNEGKRLMSVIIGNTRRMGKLIDDLLEFSRLGRKEMQMSAIEMRPLVETILTNQLEQEPSRKIQVAIHPLHTGYGDIDMIREVWVNLISNAIKYTGKSPDPTIEIGSKDEGNEVHYFVTDNGVGFDMQYAGKLFGVFQRLHRVQDFPGTGVGLAIVKRIINKHRGRIWAESEINQGATFHFTIPKKDGK